MLEDHVDLHIRGCLGRARERGGRENGRFLTDISMQLLGAKLDGFVIISPNISWH